MALGDPSGAQLAATGLAGLGALGVGLRRSSAERACKAAADATLSSLGKSSEFEGVDLVRVQTLLQDRAATTGMTTGDLCAAYKKADGTARADALAQLLFDRVPFDGDTAETQRLIKLALQSSMRACLRYIDEQAIRELVVETARQTDGMVTVLGRVENKVDEVLRQQGGIMAFLEDLANQSVDDLRTIAKAFGETGLTNRVDLIVFLTKKGEEYLDYQVQIDSLDDRVAAIANLKGAAQDAARNLDFDHVETLLVRVDEVETEIAAETKIARAKNALVRGRHDNAFRILAASADSFAAIDPLEPARRRHEYAVLLLENSTRFGGPALTLAEKMVRQAIGTFEKANDPILWANLHNTLGIVLRDQGSRTPGDAGNRFFDKAIEASREALSLPAERQGLGNWVNYQNNLANTLSELGARNTGPDGNDHLVEAVQYFRQTFKVLSPRIDAKGWAAAKNNFASALINLGKRVMGSQGLDLLAESAAASRQALTKYTKNAFPVLWAGSQNNLGIALSNQGRRTPGTEGAKLLKEASDAYELALEVQTREDHPIAWARTKENLAVLEKSLADHDSTDDPEPHLQAALVHIEAALTVYPQAHSPFDFGTATRLRDQLRSRLGE